MNSAHSGRMGLELVPKRKQHVITNMMQFYFYDFTRYLDFDLNDQGLFATYPDLDQFWKKRDRKYPFLITYDQRPAGFALIERVEDSEEADYYMTEFFVMQKYRRFGLGSWAARELFDRFQGRWKVSQVSTNQPAQTFWRKVIGVYTDGRYQERIDPERGNPSQYFSSGPGNR
ncbi:MULTISPECIES: GNAT family N-acetyltransferase [Paenibacillus]|uniref:GNAT family N-acetyltransferase n=1 Tax=Paenibacillus campinasensis TaxID=66347 RepID=A0A268F269_9BACL|nr:MULTISPECIES: GNAT family N-acetyltransferase [Paenibacillus]MUG65833.1 GNAT family N-acetyltransferase [Paenibacillus campinasensis]PAD79424.1 GNAT family N-acetyltransferase [Paenibacillus campinasensis]PAK51634.1 GNAT family N-acetyltransferase [Paenibacillus sp. 7541]